MNYKSTRDVKVNVPSAYAISQGLSSDGGLFVPENLPKLSEEKIMSLCDMSYAERAYEIFRLFLTDFTDDEIKHCVNGAYNDKNFATDNIAEISHLFPGTYILELWHGPTCAFKDMALQILPYLLTTSAKKTIDGKKISILVATSGDTGKAALEGFKDVDGTSIMVFYPEDGVSNMQKRQMTTQEGSNVNVCAVVGNFDDCQSGVKQIFTDKSVIAQLEKANTVFSSANSINWGRLAPQIIYYVSSYVQLVKDGELKYGEKLNVVVPTGNFGNILAAYYAKQMGIPIGKLICASNANNVLTDFIRTGVYNKNRPFHTTSSPSMDILVSSNLERLLYDMTGGNDALVASWMKSLNDAGVYTVNAEVKAKMDELFYGGYCDEQGTKAAIKEMFETENYLIDPHTAVAVNVYQQYLQETGDLETPAIIASTASPYKFAASVLEALTGERGQGSEFDKVAELSALTGTQIPQPIADLQQKPLRFAQVCNIAGMEMAVLGTLGIQ